MLFTPLFSLTPKLLQKRRQIQTNPPLTVRNNKNDALRVTLSAFCSRQQQQLPRTEGFNEPGILFTVFHDNINTETFGLFRTEAQN